MLENEIPSDREQRALWGVSPTGQFALPPGQHRREELLSCPFTDLHCGAEILMAESYVSNPSAGNFMQDLRDQNRELMTHLSDLNSQVLNLNITGKGSYNSMDW